jgi:hypothetical protein
MNYLLVIQFDGASAENFDRLIVLEEELGLLLGASATVDGHDFGLGEMNIFIFTEQPTRTFEKIHALLLDRDPSHSMRAAYRDVSEDGFVILWPVGREVFEVA